MSALSIQPTYPIFTDIDGQPLEDGFVWIGQANLDPQVNPISVFWDAALTIPAGQPIRTLGGYPSNSGTPARLYVNSDYSIRVMNKNGSVVYSAPVATERYNADVITSVSVNAEDVVYDPPFMGAVSTNVEAKLAQYVSVKDFGAVGDYNPSTGTGTDDTAAIQAALDASFNVFFPEGFYKITASLNLANDHNLTGEWSSDEGTRIWATGCTTFNVVAKNTRIEGFRIYQDDGYYAFFYDAPSGEASSFNNLNSNNYVVNGGAFNLVAFSRSVITNFNSAELKQGIYLSGGVVVNNAISDSLFQGRGNPALNVTGEFAVKVDIGSGGSKEGVSFTNVKFVSFYDGFINNSLSYSTFESCIFDYINNSGYTNSGFNINITFSNCYFGQQAYVAFPVVNGYSAFLNPLSLPSEAGMFVVFDGCYFVCYDPTYGPQVLANIRENNNQFLFVNCTDKVSQTNQSIALVQAKGCIIKDNLAMKEVVASGAYSATPNYVFDQSNTVETLYQGSIREFSSRTELLTSPNANAGTLTSQIMTVNSTDSIKVFKVFVHQESGAYGSSKEYLIYMDYVQDASVNDGIELITTASLGSGDLNRITPTLTATGANTNKTMTFVWSQNITPRISIERVL